MKRIHPSGDPDPRSILVVLPTWVGDFVMATPTLRAIRNRFTHAHITFLMVPNLRDLVAGGDWMNECVEWPVNRGQPSWTPLSKSHRDWLWDLRRRRFDWAVLLPNSFRSALLARMIGAKRRIGYVRDGRGWLLTDRLPVKNGQPRHFTKIVPPHSGNVDDHAPLRSRLEMLGGSSEASRTANSKRADRIGLLPSAPGRSRFVPIPLVEYYADLAEAIGCERPGDRLELFTTQDTEEAVSERLVTLGLADHRPLIVISPGARYGAAKCWLPERFAAVADELMTREGASIVVTCGPGEESIARRIASEMRHGGIVFDKPRLTLGELKSLIRRSDLLICNDAGPRHLAKAFEVPVVTIFGPTHPEWTATKYDAERIVRIDVDCGPCQQRLCPLGHLKCMTGVSVEAVLTACRTLLAARLQQRVR